MPGARGFACMCNARDQFLKIHSIKQFASCVQMIKTFK
jgi:hypothetical protein